MDNFLTKIEKKLSKRETNKSKRSLYLPPLDSIDFSSNDYLGFSRDFSLFSEISKRHKELVLGEQEQPVIHQQNNQQQQQLKANLGSTGSRLLSGNNSFYENLEQFLQTYHDGESALLFNSGYDLNLGLISCLATKQDIFVFDSLCHNSIREGLKLSRAKSKVIFKHNDVYDLASKLSTLREKNRESSIFVLVESVYSMDGDIAPLEKILKLCSTHNALLIVDEAHGLGVLGKRGVGVVQGNNLHHHKNLLCRVYTFGKALGCHGAVCICPLVVKNYLLNYCRPLIYSTSLDLHSLITIEESYKYLSKEADLRQSYLSKLIKIFHNNLEKYVKRLDSDSPIQGVVLSGNEVVINLCSQLSKFKFDIRPIRSPTVPKRKERLRIILHYHNSIEDVINLCEKLNFFTKPPCL